MSGPNFLISVHEISPYGLAWSYASCRQCDKYQCSYRRYTERAQYRKVLEERSPPNEHRPRVQGNPLQRERELLSRRNIANRLVASQNRTPRDRSRRYIGGRHTDAMSPYDSAKSATLWTDFQ